MANTIKFKRGSGSDPGTSDLSVGELAIRTDTAKLFTKNDAGSVVEVSGGVDDGDKGDITVSSSGAVFTIDNGVVNNAKVASDASIALSKLEVITSNRIVGNDSGNAVPKELTAAEVRTIINVEDGATNNGSGNAITDGDKGDITVSSSGGTFTIDNDVVTTAKMINFPTQTILGRETAGTGNATTLNASQVRSILNVEDGATADQTASDIKTLLQSSKLTSSEIADDAIGTDQIASGSITSARIADGAIVNADVNASAAIAGTKISPDFGSQTITTSGHIDIPDDAKIKIGTGDDLQLYHNGTNSFIENTTGYLRITGTSGQVYIQSNDDVSITGHTADENMAIFHKNGAVELYFDNGKKAETVTGGFTVTGTCTATAFAGDGSSLTGISAGATGGGSDEIFYENGQNVTTNYTITNGKNAMSAGPITINSGVTVTVGAGETLTIV